MKAAIVIDVPDNWKKFNCYNCPLSINMGCCRIRPVLHITSRDICPLDICTVERIINIKE